MRYYSIRYAGLEIMQVWADCSRSAKASAIYTLQREGRAGRNLAKLEAI